MQVNEANLDEFVYWVNEREMVRTMKESGAPRPWSSDPILNKHHFCNVRREHDRGTRELYKARMGLEIPMVELPQFFTAARLFNKADTLVDYWLSGPQEIKHQQSLGKKVFNTAYVVSTCGKTMNKVDYVHDVVMKVSFMAINPLNCRAAFHDLRKVDGLGSFLCGQIIADLKYTPYLEEAPDWHDFAVMGPGSQKGLNLLFGAGTTERNFDTRLFRLRELTDYRIPSIHNQDLQNCLCEFSKYMRYKHNLPGRRRSYP